MRASVTFPAKVVRDGNSIAVRIPISAVISMGLKPGDDVDVTVRIPEVVVDNVR